MQCLSCQQTLSTNLPEPLIGQFNPDYQGVKCRFSAGYASVHDGLQGTFYLCDDCVTLHLDNMQSTSNFWWIFDDAKKED